MSNRIKGPDSSVIDNGGTRAVEHVRRAAATPSATKPADSPVDSVHITSSARELLALQQAIKDVPDIDSSRVDALRQSIEQQQYQVNAESIADRLLQLEGDLLATRDGNDKQ